MVDAWRNRSPPEFGHAMLDYFAFDPEWTNLNHGAYGSLPLPVMEACKILDAEAESSPDRWMWFGYLPRLTAVRQKIATMIGAKTEECVMVTNASHGISTVLRNIEWQKDDIIVVFSTTYNSVARTARYISDMAPHPVLSEIKLVFPTTPSKVVALFRDHLRHLPRKNGQKVVAIIDTIISLPAILLPWREMVQVCKEEGVTSVVDAAHSIGQEPNIDLHKTDPDFWISNAHKWLYAKRSCAVLYVPLRNQHIIKSTFPTSDTYLSPAERAVGGDNFVKQFNWAATVDFVPYLSVAAALDFRHWLGGEDKINAYCRKMAVQGSQRLAQILGTTATVIDPTGEMTLNMVNVHLPLPSNIQPSSVLQKMAAKMILGRNIFARAFFLEETGWWIRCSAQVWTEIGDFEKLGNVLVAICPEIVHELREEEARLKSKL
ncbi:pyridoxal phosphate-dependent transferase [Mycena epipterygia]|nr:pyridoxal phosphate-dependent transferase [Mycena epipterygia]